MKTLILILTTFCAYFAGMFALTAGADVYSDTTLLEARSMISDKYQKELESRLYASKILDAFEYSSVQLDPQVVAVEGQTAKVMYLKDKKMTVKTARSCSTSGEQSGSGIDTLAKVDRMVEFSISKTQAANNKYGYAGIFAHEYYNAQKSLFLTGTNSVDAYLAAQLAAWVSTVNLGNGDDGTLAGSVMEITKDNVNRFYDIARGHMMLNNYGQQQFMDIHNSFWASTHREGSYGVQTNIIDTAAAQGFMTFGSNTITKGVGYSSNHYLIPVGGIGIVFLDPVIFAQPEDRGTYKRFQLFGDIYPNVKLNIKHVKECSDRSTYGGVVDDDLDTWQVSVQLAAFDAVLTTAGETTVHNYKTLAT